MEQAKKSRLIITTFSTGKIHPKYLYTIIYLYQTMPWFNFLFQDSGFNLFALTVVAVWTIVWQGLALWHAARHNQRNWFIALIILNFAGLLPIIYLIWYKQEQKKLVRKKKALTNDLMIGP